MALYRKRPVVIEAWQWLGNVFEDWLDGKPFIVDASGASLEIKTLEGVMKADVGDWIIKGVKGEFYPCKPDIFAITYEPSMTTDPTPAVAEARATEAQEPTRVDYVYGDSGASAYGDRIVYRSRKP